MSAADVFIVTLDGPAGVGKTTLAREVAERLGIRHMDTGAMFRSLALGLGEGAERLPADELRARCARRRFSLEGVGRATRLFCDGAPVGDEIRAERVGTLASRIAVLPVIRGILRDAQRALAAGGPTVAEGRDMGTAVFPDARFKFFLDARPEVRALRRLRELELRGERADPEEIAERIRQRDERDRNRAEAPLKPADDAVLVDTSDLGVEEVLDAILTRIRADIGCGGTGSAS